MKRIPKSISKETIVTTIKMDVDIYDQFRADNIKNRFTLQDLVNKAMYLYVKDTEFKNKILNFIVPKLSVNSNNTITLNCTSSIIPTSNNNVNSTASAILNTESSEFDISSLSETDLIELGIKEQSQPDTTINNNQ